MACWYQRRYGVPKDAPEYVKTWVKNHRKIDEAISQGSPPSSKIAKIVKKALDKS